MPPRGSRPAHPARQSRPVQTVKSPRSKAGTFSYKGETYKLSAELGVWPLLQFARASEAGWRTDDPRGLAALHAFLEDVIDPEDWGRFQEDMIKKKVVDIFGLMTAAQEAVDTMMDAMAQAGELDEKEHEEDSAQLANGQAQVSPRRELT